MTTIPSDTPMESRKKWLALFALAGMIGVILSALAFEHIGGYQPCKLCLEQRWPWYVGIPIMLVATLGFFADWPDILKRGIAAVVAIILLYSFYLGVHHSGVEWGFWQGPGDCGVVDGGLSTNALDLFKQLEETVTPSCTDAALRVLGLSFAGWNAVASLALAGLVGFLAVSKS